MAKKERKGLKPIGEKGLTKLHKKLTPQFKEKEITETLRVEFTEKEKQEKAMRIASVIRDRDAKIGEFGEVKAHYAGEIKKLETEIASLASAINSGWEMRPVNCLEKKDYRTGTCVVTRLDTKEKVSERALTAAERQTTMPLKTKEENKEEEKGTQEAGSGDKPVGASAETGKETLSAKPDSSPEEFPDTDTI
jgi:hypothetical protein